MHTSLFACLLTGLFISNTAFAQYEAPRSKSDDVPSYASPAYSNAVAHYVQTPVDQYSDNPTGAAASFEQQFSSQLFVSGHYKDASTGISDSTYDLETEDMQLGIGWFERSQVGPFVDTSFLIGRETMRLPDSETGYERERSDYFGAQIGLRETHGPLEVQAAAGYFFHSGDRDDQFRWSLSAYINMNRYLSIGLGFEHHDNYEIRSLRLRLRL